MRWRLDLSYDGTDFHGWAAQPGLRTVEETLAAALGRVVRGLEQPVRLTCAGRTDAGVHATGQVVHVDLPADVDDTLVRRLNAVLPNDIAVRAATIAPGGFDARFAASWRRYRYRICDRPAALNPLLRRQVWVLHRDRPLDEQAMNAASALLVGEHDFVAFCKQRAGASTVRELQAYAWRRNPDGLLEATVRADAFCHSMVRSLVGAAVVVGSGRRAVGWPAEVLAARQRDPAVQVAPAHGLTLAEVGYPEPAGLAERTALTRTVRGPLPVGRYPPASR